MMQCHLHLRLLTRQAGIHTHVLDRLIPVICSGNCARVRGEAQAGDQVRVPVPNMLKHQLPDIHLTAADAHVCCARIAQMGVVRPCMPDQALLQCDMVWEIWGEKSVNCTAKQ